MSCKRIFRVVVVSIFVFPALLLPAAARAQPATGRLTFSRDIRYETPVVEDVRLGRTTRLIRRDAVPSSVSIALVFSEKPPSDMTMEVDAATRQIQGRIAAIYEKALGPGFPVNVTPYFNAPGRDERPGLVAEGYEYKRTETKGDKWIAIYARETYAADADFGEALATFTLRAKPRIDPVGRISLNFERVGKVRVQTRRVPSDAPPAVVKVMLARFENEVSAEADGLARQINAKPVAVGPEENKRFLNGEPEVPLTVPLKWEKRDREVRVIVAATLGGVILVEPGKF